MATFGEMVRAARERRGLSATSLAREVGVSPSQISRIESGDRGTDVDTLARLVRVLGLDAGASLDALAPVDAPEEPVVLR